jgi:hypothetical protein
MSTKVSDFLPVRATEEQVNQLNEIATGFSIIAEGLVEVLPDGPHKSTALRKLLEAKMFAAQAITHEPEFEELSHDEFIENSLSYPGDGSNGFYLLRP